MIIYTDDIAYAEEIFTVEEEFQSAEFNLDEPALERLSVELSSGGTLYKSSTVTPGRWRYAFAIQNAPRSQFDILVGLGREGVTLPDGIICVAGSGEGFHGQRGRPWSAIEGNLHLSVFLAPRRQVDRFYTGFSLLAAVALTAAIDRFEPLREVAGIKWVNDLLIDGAKVAGFLAHTTSIEERVTSAVLGIGLNVETTPTVSADRFVPRVASLRDFMPDSSRCNQRLALRYILENLQSSYETLLNGGYVTLLDQYRERSLIVGREVRILTDTASGSQQEIAAGRVEKIGHFLELYLDNYPQPVTTGRLMFESEHA